MDIGSGAVRQLANFDDAGQGAHGRQQRRALTRCQLAGSYSGQDAGAGLRQGAGRQVDDRIFKILSWGSVASR